MTYHGTEMGPDEVFLGNTPAGRPLPPEWGQLKTLRFGRQAYDLDGHKLPTDYQPVFIGRAEHAEYDRIMMARLSAIRRGEKVTR